MSWDSFEQNAPLTPQMMNQFNGPFPEDYGHQAMILTESGDMVDFNENSYSPQEIEELLGPEVLQTLHRMKVQKAMQPKQKRMPFSDGPAQPYVGPNSQFMAQPSMEQVEVPEELLRKSPVLRALQNTPESERMFKQQMDNINRTGQSPQMRKAWELIDVIEGRNK